MTKKGDRRVVNKSTPAGKRSVSALLRAIGKADVHYDFNLAEHPNWLHALDDETDPNPLDSEVNRRIDLAQPTQRQIRQMRKLKERFAELLLADMKPLWLELNRVQLSAQIAYSVMYFNVGFDSGRDMVAVTEAVRRAGIDPCDVEQTNLFRLSYELAQIARELAGKPG